LGLSVNTDLVIRDEEFGNLVHHIQKGLIYVMNDTGKMLLKLCNGTRTIDDVITEVRKDYECDQTLVAQLHQFLQELVKNDILLTDEQPNSTMNQVHNALPSFSPLMSFESNPLSRTILSAPIVLYWEITNVCNLRCLHCYKNASENPEGHELDTAEMKRIIDQLAEQKVFWLAVTGGEPLLKKDVFDLLHYASSKKICIMLSTNGTLVDDEKAKKLKEAGVLSVQVSIDGIGKVHDEFRGREGTFEKAVNAVRCLIRAGIPDVTISSVATRINLQEIPKIVELAISLGVSRYRIITLMPTGRAKSNMQRLWLSNDEKKQLRKLLLETTEKYSDKIHISQEERSFNLINNHLSSVEVPLGCAAARSIAKISPQGNVYPCSFFDDNKTIAGNLRQKSFREIWAGAELFKQLRSMDHIEGRCASCKNLKFCGGGCRAVAYNFSGTIYAEDPECWLVVR